jgi:hypothetical protein
LLTFFPSELGMPINEQKNDRSAHPKVTDRLPPRNAKGTAQSWPT